MAGLSVLSVIMTVAELGNSILFLVIIAENELSCIVLLAVTLYKLC